MHEPVRYHIRHAYPATATTAEPPFVPSATLRCAHDRHYLSGEAFDLAYSFHDAKDMFIAVHEIHAHLPLSFPITCTHADLHGCYVSEGRFTLREQDDDVTALSLHAETYTLIYAPRGVYMVSVPRGITIIYLWTTNKRMLLRYISDAAFIPIRPLLLQLKSQGPSPYPTRVLPFGHVPRILWQKLLRLPLLRPLTMDLRLYEAVAALIDCCMDALREQPQGSTKTLNLLHNVRAYIINEIKKGSIPRVDEVVERSGVSESYLLRIHRRYYGTSPQAFIMAIRLRHARDLILTGRYTYTQVAYAVGFSALHDFNKQYKKFFKCYPRETKAL
ncbi:AraC-type DNA-binding protein [Parapedobacter koreensis]|uniref:AraC-type DNA-binding protein n=2 Tax=Parapedobacter koreensis TaxID=332977 RepID=A0A1H7MDM0_9SPHI|nr:AraC-type DNA-binding protein [Parapedobacter koreensis]